MNELVELRRKVEELSERVAALETGLFGKVDGLSGREALVIALFMNRPLVTKEAYAIATGLALDGSDSGLDVYICRLRKKLGITFELQRGRGWFLTVQTKRALQLRLEAAAVVAGT
jgi:DNA-binding response OmpR family regulator